METVDHIDALLNAEKTLTGTMRWTGSRESTVRLKVALSIGGEVIGGLFLYGDAATHTKMQQGSIVLVYRNVPIERMNVFPSNPHVNPLHKSLSRDVRGRVFEAFTHRYYPWQANRRWPRPPGDNLQVAEKIGDEFVDFRGALRYFCHRVRLVGDIPAPPHEPRLEFA